MNHYMLPHWNGDGLPTPKFGNVAIPRLIQALLNNGSKRENLEAKLFGGGDVLLNNEDGSRYQIGERNADLAVSMLEEASIPVVALKLCPKHGLKIRLRTDTGEVWVKRVKRLGESKSTNGASS